LIFHFTFLMIGHLTELSGPQSFGDPEFVGYWDEETSLFSVDFPTDEPFQVVEDSTSSPFCSSSSSSSCYTPDSVLVSPDRFVVGVSFEGVRDVPMPVFGPPGMSSPGHVYPEHVPGQVLNGPPQRQSPYSRNKNRIAKGAGRDAVDDPAGRDDYPFKNGRTYNIVHPSVRKSESKVLLGLVKCLVKKGISGLTPANRWVGRRVPNACSWMDENGAVISEELLRVCLGELRASGLEC
jgi:hypothetical protein